MKLVESFSSKLCMHIIWSGFFMSGYLDHSLTAHILFNDQKLCGEKKVATATTRPGVPC